MTSSILEVVRNIGANDGSGEQRCCNYAKTHLARLSAGFLCTQNTRRMPIVRKGTIWG